MTRMRAACRLATLVLLTTLSACMPQTPPPHNDVSQDTKRGSIDELEVVFKPALFCSDTFPRCDFDHPGRARQILGKYELRPTFYDNEYRPVTAPMAPGRYGAVVDIVSEKGGKFAARNVTLYRYPGDQSLRPDDLKITLQFDARLGLNSAVARAQDAAMLEFFGSKMMETLRGEPDAALLFAALGEIKPSDPPLAGKNSIWARDQRWWLGLKRKLNQPGYRSLSWPTTALSKKGEKRPVVLFLHGSGERGENLNRVKLNGPAKLADAGREFPFLLIVPQCPAQEWWCAQQLIDLLDEVSNKYPVDQDRVYLTGLSMGGYGAWELAAEYPDRFAAIAPVCGAGSPAEAAVLKHIPAWIFHGQEDDVVPVERSLEMADALRKAGAKPRLTVYEKTGHDSWSKAYADDALYEWLLMQRRK